MIVSFSFSFSFCFDFFDFFSGNIDNAFYICMVYRYVYPLILLPHVPWQTQRTT